ncbi:MAG: peptide ABC transporter substrate-binding protein [Oscillospiraceae bacterium]
MKKLLLIILLLTAAITLGACGDDNDGADGTFYTVIPSNPQNLDPQLAEDSESLSVIRNIFEGLTEISETGDIVCAAAENYAVSDDMLTYTFRLREGMTWSGAGGFSAEVTAHDYVYAFRRIFDPEIHSPYTDEFAALKNSAAVYDGVMSYTDLGVKALDDYTLQFELDYPVSDFLYLLSTGAASPCCEEFFLSTGGRYGLSAEYTAGNGAFTLTEWNYDPYWNENFLTLKRNPDNSTEERRTYPLYVNYIITDSAEEYEKTSGNTVDVMYCEAEDIPKLRGKKAGEYPVYAVGVTFNMKDEIFSNENIRKALSITSDPSVYEGRTSAGISWGRGVLPPAVTVMGRSVRDLLGDYYEKQSGGAELWSRGLAETGGNYPELSVIIVPESFADAPIVYMLTDSWNEELGFSCGVEILSDEEYSERIAEGNYSAALSVITADSPCASDFFESFEEYVSDPDDLEEYRGIISAERYSASANAALKSCKEAEKLLTENGYYIPVFYESKLLVTENSVSDVIFEPFSGTLCFKSAKKYS